MIRFVFGHSWLSLKTGLSWINITAFSKLWWLFLNSEMIPSLFDVQKNHFQDKCSLATSLNCPQVCWQFWFHGNNNVVWSVHLWVHVGEEFETKVWKLSYSFYVACQKRKRGKCKKKEKNRSKEVRRIKRKENSLFSLCSIFFAFK